MKHKTRIALSGAVIAIAALAAPTGLALAAGSTTVTVRVEGLNRTLLAPTAVHVRSGSVTKYGVKQGKCPDTSAQGALDAATHDRWAGKWYSSYSEYLITSVLGESYGSSSKDYWSLWVNNKFAQVGACDVQLHNGDQVLFAVEGAKTADPLGLTGPASAKAGRPFTVKVVAYSSAGKSKPLAGATVTGNGVSVKTGSGGTATITSAKAGTLVLNATDSGYIRAAPLRVRVS